MLAPFTCQASPCGGGRTAAATACSITKLSRRSARRLLSSWLSLPRKMILVASVTPAAQLAAMTLAKKQPAGVRLTASTALSRDSSSDRRRASAEGEGPPPLAYLGPPPRSSQVDSHSLAAAARSPGSSWLSSPAPHSACTASQQTSACRWSNMVAGCGAGAGRRGGY